MSETLESYFKKSEAKIALVQNLKMNLDMLTKLNQSSKDALMRMNLIMIRQCLQDHGVD